MVHILLIVIFLSFISLGLPDALWGAAWPTMCGELLARLSYAGGISDYQDITHIKEIGDGRINITIGSALDLFGGNLNYETVLKYVQDV